MVNCRSVKHLIRSLCCYAIPELWCSDGRNPQHQTDMVFRCSDGQVVAHQAYLKEFCKIFAQICFGVKSMVRYFITALKISDCINCITE